MRSQGACKAWWWVQDRPWSRVCSGFPELRQEASVCPRAQSSEPDPGFVTSCLAAEP